MRLVFLDEGDDAPGAASGFRQVCRELDQRDAEERAEALAEIRARANDLPDGHWRRRGPRGNRLKEVGREYSGLRARYPRIPVE